VCVYHGLEGVVAKRLRSPYRSGERGWMKVKNRDYWRYPLEVEAAAAMNSLKSIRGGSRSRS